jgi:hypothetical protein
MTDDLRQRGLRLTGGTVHSERGGLVAGQNKPANKAPGNSALMIPFPLPRRARFVAGLAAQVAERGPDAGELHLLAQLNRQRDALERKGVAKGLIEQELRALADAVRAELWRLLAGERA